ncbi:MAG: TlyA family RNA methyltransferase [Deltaproteobacteria bacterium]|nr:TlyA family RNA methyltransferase [Deltaproteobacteria bacterium]
MKQRADVLLVSRGLCESRTRAQALIMAGAVYSGERRIAKPGDAVPEDAPLRVAEAPRFVSRGGDKLEGALGAFAANGLDVAGRVAVDVGASTGGFTDCLLQRGAAKVYAVDVGWGQLHAKLRVDARVVVMERTNARSLEARSFAEPVTLVVVDASFIGIGKLMPAIAAMLVPGGDLVALVKPQFEAGREAVARGRGVIRDEAVRARAIADALVEIEAAGFVVVGSVDSAVAGPKGNVEHLVHARRSG